ncbi:hypothetical protein GOV12_06920 [Candidatus Pacearchaeota archaeon]|nr:hypothetical protein [Candidatus Pacearchaeota archaeon]
MVKTKIMKSESALQSLKGCYGTDEWSANSGICCQCKLKNDCGKIRMKRLGN